MARLALVRLKQILVEFKQWLRYAYRSWALIIATILTGKVPAPLSFGCMVLKLKPSPGILPANDDGLFFLFLAYLLFPA